MRLGVNEMERIKSLGEPVVDTPHDVSCLLVPTLSCTAQH